MGKLAELHIQIKSNVSEKMHLFKELEVALNNVQQVIDKINQSSISIDFQTIENKKNPTISGKDILHQLNASEILDSNSGENPLES